MTTNSLIKEILTLAKDDKNLNILLEQNSEYAFALEKCVNLGFISGLACERNMKGVPVFQKTEAYSVTVRGLKFLENSSLDSDL